MNKPLLLLCMLSVGGCTNTLTWTDYCVAQLALQGSCVASRGCCPYDSLQPEGSDCTSEESRRVGRRVCELIFGRDVGPNDPWFAFDAAAAQAQLDRAHVAVEACLEPAFDSAAVLTLRSRDTRGAYCGGYSGILPLLLCSASGTYCSPITDRCEDYAELDEYCDTAVLCRSDLYCSSWNRCTWRLGLGEYCGDSEECDDPLTCAPSGLCEERDLSSLRPDGAGCTYATDCLSGTCAAGRCVTLNDREEYYCDSM
jgi:hypothetical protein